MWRKSIKVLGLDISETYINPSATGGGWMGDTIGSQVEGLGGPGAEMPKVGRCSA